MPPENARQRRQREAIGRRNARRQRNFERHVPGFASQPKTQFGIVLGLLGAIGLAAAIYLGASLPSLRTMTANALALLALTIIVRTMRIRSPESPSGDR